MESYQTIYGGFISLTCMVVVIIFSLFLGQDFFYKKNPHIVRQTVTPEEYLSPFSLTPKNFVVAWRLTDSNSNTLNESGIVYPVLTYSESIRSGSTLTIIRKENLELTRCNSQNSQMEVAGSKNYNFKFYCFDWTKGNYSLGGFTDGNYSNNFELTLAFCPGGKDFGQNNNCTSLEDSLKFFTNRNNVYFEIFLPHFHFAPDNLSSPMKVYSKSFYFTMSLNTWRVDRVFTSQYSVFDDQGWIMENIQNIFSYGVENVLTDLSFYESKNFGLVGTSSKFYRMKFYCTKSYEKISRKFLKFQDYLAIIGGFFKIILLIGKTISRFISVYDRNNRLWSEFFIFEKNNEIRVKNYQNKYKKSNNLADKSPNISQQINHSAFSNINDKLIQEKTISDLKNELFQYKIMKYKKNKINEMEFGFSFKIKTCFGLRKMKLLEQKVYNSLHNHFIQQLDVINYLKCLKKIDLLYYLFLNRNQILAMEYLKPPNLYDQREIVKLQNKINTEKDLSQISKYFEEKLKNNSLNELDIKLLEMISPKMNLNENNR